MMQRHRFGRRIGMMLHGSTFWISELSALIIVALLLVALAALSFSIVSNEYLIHRMTKRIAAEKTERIMRTLILDELREQTTIAELLGTIGRKRLSRELILDLTGIIHVNSRQYGYDPLLLLAVIEVESVFRPEALGRYRDGTLSGALGLMQLKPATAQEVADRLGMGELSLGDLFKPEINIALGVAYLATMISRFRSFKLGLLAYNQGPGTISKKLSQNEPLSVRYYSKVLQSYYQLKERSHQLATIIDGEAPQAYPEARGGR